MKTNKTIAIIAILAAFGGLFSLTACNKTEIEEEIPSTSESVITNESTEHTHTYANYYQHDNEHHWRECSCGYEEITAYGEHDWDDGVVITQATFTQTGSKVLTCETCGYTKYESIAAISLSDENNYTYRLADDNTYVVTGSKYSELRNIVIPSTYKGVAVTEIDDYAFYATDIVSVDIPQSIKSIGAHAFEDCEYIYDFSIEGNSKTVVTFNDNYTSLTGLSVGTAAFKNTPFTAITVADSIDGDTLVPVTVSNSISDIKSIKIVSALNTTTDIKFENVIKLDKKTTNYVGELDFGTYGLFNSININAYDNSGNVVATINAGNVGVTADHYNLALLNATYPVLLYTLQICGNESIYPSFVALERCDAYDWTNLPNNVQCFPFTTRYIATKVDNFHYLKAGLSSYIKQLYELNPNSTFTLYAVDNYPIFILQMLVANKIPETNWNAVLLSDGSGTASILSSTFGVDNPESKYTEMVQNWNELKEFVYQNGYDQQTVWSKIKYTGVNNQYPNLENYTYVIAKQQSNVEWQVNRLRPTENLSAVNDISPELANDIKDTAKSVNVATLLSNLTDEQKTTLKKLYHFSDEMFSEAQTQNKKVMIILGTSANNEGTASGDGANFYNYVRMTMEFYGDDYLYYYKGHPGYPTSLYPSRQTAMNQLAEDEFVLYELDNSIAAEIILFYNPDVYISGWPSTTFESVQSDNMACTLYNVSFENKGVYTYGGQIDTFITKLSAGVTEYDGITLDSTHTYYLIKYNHDNVINEAGDKNAAQEENYSKHEIAIYDSNEKTITYYHKGENSSYSVVNADGTAIES
jgi:hypothetical protein